VLQEEALNWIDAATVVTIDGMARQVGIAFPPLLGSGGNDGNLDFSTTLLQSLFSVLDPGSGEPSPDAEALLDCALFAGPARIENGIAISQYAPGSIGSPNSGAGFTGTSTGNPWDVVLGLEGTLALSAAVVRRIGMSGRGEASFPFMISRRGVVGAGAGNVDAFDEQTARGEFWGPVWERPIEYNELLALFREGRAVVERKTAGNALDFARAVGQLGVERGISYFERYAFEQRFGNMYLGVPLARHRLPRNPNPDLIADLARGGWLDRARSVVRGKGAPAHLISLARRLDEALFRLAAELSPQTAQEALIAVGKVVREIGRRSKLRENVPPPPRLSDAWVTAADPKDGSHEFALAAALASIDATASAGEAIFRLPFRRHLVPLDVMANVQGADCDAWDDTTNSQVLAVWSGRHLLRDMTAVIERRLFEAERRRFIHEHQEPPPSELPLRGWRTAPLASVTAFLAGRTNDDRVAALVAGLVWARIPRRRLAVAEREHVLPYTYAVLRPLLEPSGIGPDPEMRKIINPIPLVRLARAGRIHEAILAAQRLARGAGLSVPFPSLDEARAADPMRLAASLLFPIAPVAQGRLVARAYPDLKGTEEETDAA
jgi:CRISPR-associated protein Csx17